MFPWGTLVTMQHPRQYAQTAPDRPAAIDADSGEIRTYAELDERANRLTHALRGAGLHTGDHVAIVMDNRLEYFEVLWGAMNSGLYVTPVNWHLAADEVNYIVDDCGAQALVVVGRRHRRGRRARRRGPRAAARARRRARRLRRLRSRRSPRNPPDRSTTRPRAAGCSTRPAPPAGPRASSRRRSARRSGRRTRSAVWSAGSSASTEGSVYLCPAPLYHSAPAGWSTTVQRLGGTVVAMHHFDAEACLAAIERYRVTHVQFVPTHLVRILKLDEDVRASTTCRACR